MKTVREIYCNLGRVLWISLHCPTKARRHATVVACGLLVILAGLEGNLIAQTARDSQFSGGHRIAFNDTRIAEAINAILTYLEGTFGAMIMVAAGIGAILSSAFGQYRAALGLLVVAVGAFILRSLIGTFFNDVNIQP